MKGLSEVCQVSKIHWGSVCVWPTLCTQGILSHKETQRQPMTTFVYGEWRCIIFIFRLLLVSQWGFEGIRELFSLSHDDPSGKIFCPIGRKKSNVKVNLDLWETQHTHVIMLIMTMHNFQFFISPLEMGKKEIFITALCNMSFMLLRNAIRLPGSGPKGLEEEQIFWFGHPWQAVPFPACSLPVPGQSVKIEEK